MSMSTSSAKHKAEAAKIRSIPVALVTVSDSRTEQTDKNAQYLREHLTALGHTISSYHLIKDDPQAIEHALEEICHTEARIVLINGGTGIAPRDTTFDVVSRRLEKVLPGFGELFRVFSYEEVGAAAMLSRAVAGIYRQRVVFSMPGSPNAVWLAWTKLIEPELNHLAWEVVREH